MTGNPRYRRLVLAVTIAGAFMVTLDTTIVNIAIATLAADFGTDVDGVQWVLTAYLLAVGVVIPGCGDIADRFGSKKVFLLALGGFTVASALCAAAPNLPALVAFRVLQGLTGGAVLPLGFAMALRVIPPEQRGRYLGVLAMPILLAPALGPIAGGYLIERWSWHWIFLINLPIGLAVGAAALRGLREERLTTTGPFDLAGLALSGGGLAALLYGIVQAPTRGWLDPLVLAAFALAVVALAAFARIELRHRSPLLDLRLFADRPFALGNAVIGLAAVGLFGGLFLLPLFFQQVAGRTPLDAGLLLLPQGLGLFLASPAAGVLYDRFGARWPVTAGALVTAVTTAFLARIDVDTGAWELAPILFLRGVGVTLVFTPAQTAALANVGGAAMARASSSVSALRQVAAALGVAVTATLLQARWEQLAAGAGAGPASLRQAGEQAFGDVFLITAVALLPAVAAALFLPRGAPSPAAAGLPAVRQGEPRPSEGTP